MSQGVRAGTAVKTILGVAGSLRRGSYNRSLLEAAAESARPGMSIVLYDELASIPPFNGDLELATGGGPDAVCRLRRQVASADGLLVATPEYNHSIPGVLKNAIDWLSRPGPEEVLVGKPVALVGASSGEWGTRLAQSALRQVFY
ncbi:MAG TPA: NAD(P)H-dependent oxidoreductase, partial [Vicinamibacteria bacterium]|nr:NAD(P)H-dependent oxidoreductase [Vicinamibacteria bacterium]